MAEKKCECVPYIGKDVTTIAKNTKVNKISLLME